MAAKRLLISALATAGAVRGSGSYSPSTLETKEFSLALLADYAEAQGWPGVEGITAAHVEEYLYYLQTRPRWFGERG